LHYTPDLLTGDRSLAQVLREAQISWHGVELNQPDWSPDSRSLAITVSGQGKDRGIHLLCNTDWQPRDFALPSLPVRKKWRRMMDTNLTSPDDFLPWRKAPVIDSARYQAAPRSIVLLAAG
jgi:glycogen operon protein